MTTQDTTRAALAASLDEWRKAGGREDEPGEGEARLHLLHALAPLGLRGGFSLPRPDEGEARGDDARPGGAGGAEGDTAVVAPPGFLDEAGA